MMVSITEDQLRELVIAHHCLMSLQAGGVDNWEQCSTSLIDADHFAFEAQCESSEFILEYAKNRV